MRRKIWLLQQVFPLQAAQTATDFSQNSSVTETLQQTFELQLKKSILLFELFYSNMPSQFNSSNLNKPLSRSSLKRGQHENIWMKPVRWSKRMLMVWQDEMIARSCDDGSPVVTAEQWLREAEGNGSSFHHRHFVPAGLVRGQMSTEWGYL